MNEIREKEKDAFYRNAIYSAIGNFNCDHTSHIFVNSKDYDKSVEITVVEKGEENKYPVQFKGKKVEIDYKGKKNKDITDFIEEVRKQLNLKKIIEFN
jgi:hypothetical protein